MIKKLKRLYYQLIPHYERLEFKCVTYSEADRLMKQDPSWVLAKEEDNNHNYGVVFIERKKRILE